MGFNLIEKFIAAGSGIEEDKNGSLVEKIKL
jgi:hypothetical protein